MITEVFLTKQFLYQIFRLLYRLFCNLIIAVFCEPNYKANCFLFPG